MSTDPDVSYGDAPAEPVVSIVIVNPGDSRGSEDCRAKIDRSAS